ncbi:Rpn family recombination-promoting nuclease/putative transposase [Xenorhabdus szentirmaii]|uniref:Rpn family recombination-promoting nuclease/putative transposase n=1 Tax=Xenorhabdus szentirmaii TaxID=290112 RepID=UPI0004B30EE1|nr:MULTISPECIES: Rpn family recombination-promoting nuclease/putative transposase [unclassified Xenorhabdus]
MQQGHKELPLVVPVLFYHGGSSPYPFQQRWTHCFSLPGLAEDIYFHPNSDNDVVTILNYLFVTMDSPILNRCSRN